MSDKCDSTTHYHGCKCHEAKRDARIIELESALDKCAEIVCSTVEDTVWHSTGTTLVDFISHVLGASGEDTDRWYSAALTRAERGPNKGDSDG